MLKPTKQDKQWFITVMNGVGCGKVSIHPALLGQWLEFGWFELDSIVDEYGGLIGTDFVTTPKGMRILKQALADAEYKSKSRSHHE